MKLPSAAGDRIELAGGVLGLAPGVAFLPAARVLIAADAHLGYEDVVGGALPLWSTAEIVTTLLVLVRRMEAREIVFLGDVIHGVHMNEGAARTVVEALDALRAEATVTLVAGNHEGRSRGYAVLGETVLSATRDGWLLVHGDRALAPGEPAIIGHLHPSLRLGPGTTIPAFLAGDRFVVVPALNPYSPGLSVTSDECAKAVRGWLVRPSELHVVAAAPDRLYPFGSLERLRETLRNLDQPGRPRRFQRRRLRPDHS